jgi:transcription antitermination factor NusG
MWDRSTLEPIVIPFKAMQDFILISNAMLEDTIYLNEINTKLKSGSAVRISDGPFKGVEGRVVRIKKSRRVMVELPGMMAVATTYIPSELLEPIHE